MITAKLLSTRPSFTAGRLTPPPSHASSARIRFPLRRSIFGGFIARVLVLLHSLSSCQWSALAPRRQRTFLFAGPHAWFQCDSEPDEAAFQGKLRNHNEAAGLRPSVIILNCRNKFSRREIDLALMNMSDPRNYQSGTFTREVISFGWSTEYQVDDQWQFASMVLFGWRQHSVCTEFASAKNPH